MYKILKKGKPSNQNLNQEKAAFSESKNKYQVFLSMVMVFGPFYKHCLLAFHTKNDDPGTKGKFGNYKIMSYFLSLN